MLVEYTSQFVRRLKKLPKPVLEQVYERVDLFKTDWQHPRLKTHKLQGKLAGYYSFSVDYDYRIIFKKQKHRFILMAIGSHDEVY